MNVLRKTTTKLGNKIELIGDNGDKNILIVGVFHGDEPQGKYLIEKYLSNICSHSHTSQKMAGKGQNNLLFIPCLNPDGLKHNTRTNANNIDLNRNFPTKNWSGTIISDGNPECQDSSLYYGGTVPGSEIETKFLMDILSTYKPKIILTLHAPYKIVNFDGPAEDIAQKISKIIGYPVEPSIGYPTPGSFGTYCGIEHNIPIITLELDEEIPIEKLIQPVFNIFDFLKIY